MRHERAACTPRTRATCQTPGMVHRLSASDGALERTVTVGICPFGIAFADVPEEDNED